MRRSCSSIRMRPKLGVAGPNTSAEVDRGAQNLHYWRNLPSDYMVTGDLGVPRKVVLLELLGPPGPAQCPTHRY